jgi:para-aminobenzoate synthetase component 1
MEPTCFYWKHHQLGPILGLGKTHEFKSNLHLDTLQVQDFLLAHQGKYIFAFLTYDLKNTYEDLTSDNTDQLVFPLLHFWVPESLYQLEEKPRFIWGVAQQENQDLAQKFLDLFEDKNSRITANFQSRTTKNRYFDQFEKLKSSLQRGDIYEVNYCQEFHVENYELANPIGLFGRLNELTKAPHAAYIQTNDHVVLCASPERFMQKKGPLLRSEPIKGTAPRSQVKAQDQQLASALQNNPKERAENIMIVDLVRNDLSQIAAKDSVKVEELCEIYSFKTVHQMISKISCQLKSTVGFTDILKACFPMGSMTGAPKIAAMQHIEVHEDFKRGLYSGSIGLIEPNGDFDFNVVIRSLLYNRQTKYLSCAVGSAITIGANAEDEYQECLLKAEKLIHGLR